MSRRARRIALMWLAFTVQASAWTGWILGVHPAPGSWGMLIALVAGVLALSYLMTLAQLGSDRW